MARQDLFMLEMKPRFLSSSDEVQIGSRRWYDFIAPQVDTRKHTLIPETEEPFAKLSKVDDFIPQKRVISGGFNPRHGHLTDVCWKSKTTTSRVRKKVNHAHYKSYTR